MNIFFLAPLYYILWYFWNILVVIFGAKFWNLWAIIKPFIYSIYKFNIMSNSFWIKVNILKVIGSVVIQNMHSNNIIKKISNLSVFW